jgi:hypothetical protein
VTGNSSFTVSGSSAITLTNASNTFTGGITLSGVTGAIALTDNSATVVTSVITTGGSFTLSTTTGGITLADNAISTGSGNVSLTSTLGSINEASNNTTANITTTGAVSLTGATGVGSASTLDISGTSNLSVDTNQSFDIINDTMLTDLAIVVDPGTTADTYSIVDGGSNLTLIMLDAGANITLNSATPTAGNLNFSLTVDTGNISLGDGAISAGSGNVTLVSTLGSINETNPTAAVNITTTGSISLKGKTGIGNASILEIDGSTNLSIDTENSFNVETGSVMLTDLSIKVNPLNTSSFYTLTGPSNITMFNLTEFSNDLNIGMITASALNLSLETYTGNVFTSGDISVGTGSFSIVTDFSATKGSITFSDNLAAGSLILDANGTDADINISSNLIITDGAATLTADNSIIFTGTGNIDATGVGNVSLTANTDNAAGAGNDNINMDSGTKVDAGSGTISLDASGTGAGNILLALLTTTSSSNSAVTITVSNGAGTAGNITDNNAAATNINAANGRLVIDAVSGVGISSALEVTVASVDIDNTFTNSVMLDATGGFSIANITSANQVLITATGAITQTGAIIANGANGLSISTSGAVTLENVLNDVNTLSILTTSGDVSYTDADGFDVDSLNSVDGVSAATGSVTLRSVTGNITVTNTAALNDVNAATGITILLSADEALFTINSLAEVENTSSGDIVITADIMDLTGSVRAMSQRVTLKSSTADDEIALGFISGAQVNRLELTTAELNNITASYLEIGSTTQGDITVISDITPANIMRLHLISGKKVTASTGGIIFSHLAIEAGGDVSFTDTSTDVDFLAISASGFDVAFYDADDLDINTVDTVVGVKAKSFSATGPGPLTTTSPIVLDTTDATTPEEQENIDTATQAGFADSFITNAAGGGC